MVASESIPHPSYPSASLSYRSLNRTLQAYICTLKGLTDLIFEPPSPISISTSPPPSPTSQSSSPSAISLPGYPETTFLDSARLVLLSTDAADATALYMFLMLYRQLVFSDPSPQPSSRTMPKVTESDLSQIKTEIQDIASCRLGYCFTRTSPDHEKSAEKPQSEDKEWTRWQKASRDIVLQLAMRATQAQHRAKSASSSTDSPSLPTSPDNRILNIAERWLDSNLRPKSPLSVLLRNRLRDAVFHRLAATTFPPREAVADNLKATLARGASLVAPIAPSSGTITGMECLTEEIQSLGEKLSKLALIHLGVYLPLYEQDKFLYS